MGYVIAAVIVILLIAGFVTFLVMNAADKSDPNAAAEDGPPGIGADAGTPLGDTSEHAGEQTAEGTTVGGQDAEYSGGTGRPPAEGPGAPHRDDPDASAHVARPGEGEGETRLEFDGRQPQR